MHRYQYKGESHAFHGGVKVTYKDRLSRVGSRLNSEYGPIETVSVPGPTPGSAHVLKTQETHDGVVFVPRRSSTLHLTLDVSQLERNGGRRRWGRLQSLAGKR